MQIVTFGDNLHEMSKLLFRGNKKNYFNLMSAETFTQSAIYALWRAPDEVILQPKL